RSGRHVENSATTGPIENWAAAQLIKHFACCFFTERRKPVADVLQDFRIDSAGADHHYGSKDFIVDGSRDQFITGLHHFGHQYAVDASLRSQSCGIALNLRDRCTNSVLSTQIELYT